MRILLIVLTADLRECRLLNRLAIRSSSINRYKKKSLPVQHVEYRTLVFMSVCLSAASIFAWTRGLLHRAKLDGKIQFSVNNN